MEVNVKETRGAKRKYDFSGFTIGEMRKYAVPTTSHVMNPANKWIEKSGLTWKFRSYTDDDGMVVLIRVK